jgi:hypothetical protein
MAQGPHTPTPYSQHDPEPPHVSFLKMKPSRLVAEPESH